MGRYYSFYKEDVDNTLTCFDTGKYGGIGYSDTMINNETDKEEIINKYKLTESQWLMLEYSDNSFILIKREDLKKYESELEGSLSQFFFRALMDSEQIDKMYMEISY